MMRKSLSRRLTVAIFAGLILGSLPVTVNAQLKCFDSYLLLNGRCPDPCSHGNQCPCITCVREEE